MAGESNTSGTVGEVVKPAEEPRHSLLQTVLRSAAAARARIFKTHHHEVAPLEDVQLNPSDAEENIHMVTAHPSSADVFQDDLHPVSQEVGIKHFQPEKDGRDRFGNRIFTSKDMGYVDKAGDEVRAAMLVSPEGQEFVRQNPGILQDIERGLGQMQEFASSEKGLRALGRLNLENGRTMEYLASGALSHALLLTVEGKNGAETRKYVLKIKNKDPNRRSYMEKYPQPYINEMLQLQALGTDLKADLDPLHVHFPTYFFASGQVMCTEYIEGGIPEDNKIMVPLLGELSKRLNTYINKQKGKKNPLWKNVWVDDFIATYIVPAGHNFVKTVDNELYWVDPIVYEKRTWEDESDDNAPPSPQAPFSREVLHGELHEIDETVQIKHFTPEKGGRDRFGNSIFASRDLGYVDKEDDEVRAAMVVSPEGNIFFQQNVGIRGAIKRGLQAMEPYARDEQSLLKQPKVDLGEGRTMEYLGSGHQSHAYLLTVEGVDGMHTKKQYVIKVKNQDPKRVTNLVSQPYVNEMLQTQAIATDLQAELKGEGVAMPTFLFATGQISCVEFVSGDRIDDNDTALRKKLGEFSKVLSKYVQRLKASGAPLWQHVWIDDYFTRGRPMNNFIRRDTDGRIVWVDPVYREVHY